MVMRVWVLASCGSLLALSACSAEPTTTAQPSPLDPSDDDLQAADRPSALEHTPGIAVDIDRALSRPELRPTRSQRAPIPSPARAQRITLTPEQLRNRVEQIRSQQIQQGRAAGRTSGMTQARTVAPPQVSQSDVTDVSLRPGMVPTTTLSITPLTPPPRPALSPAQSPSVERTSPGPSAVTPTVTQINPENEVAVYLEEESTQAADLGTPEPATLASRYPLRSTSHQSYGARHNRDTVVISAGHSSDEVDNDLGESRSPEVVTDHHHPWVAAEPTTPQASSQPLFAQTNPQPRAVAEPANLALEPDVEVSPQAEAVQPDSTQSDPGQIDATQLESVQIEATQPDLVQLESIPSESAQPEASTPDSVQSEATQVEATQSESTQPEAVQLESDQAETIQSDVPEAISPDPLSLGESSLEPWPTVEIGTTESAHWSALEPATLAAVPPSPEGPWLADPSAHQPLAIAAPTAMTEPTQPTEPATEMAALELAPQCQRPTLAKPLPPDTLADSAILEAKSIPAEPSDGEIAVVDCP
jgi:nicotinate-nucleotide--dimethylbenzimidazole phosphoribosyltransferase